MASQVNVDFDTVALLLFVLGVLYALLRSFRRRRSFASGHGRVYIGSPDILRRQILGRQETLVAIAHNIDKGNTVFVLGAPGIGKSTVGKASAMGMGEPSRRIVWVRCTSETNLDSFLDRFSHHVQVKHDENSLRNAYEDSKAHDACQWIDLLVDYISKHDYVFFMDDLHLVDDPIIISQLLPRLCATTGVVILARELTRETRTAVECATPVFEIRLRGLSDIDGVELLRRMGLSEETYPDLTELSARVGGHPKALEVCAGLLEDPRHKVTIQQLTTKQVLEDDPQQALVKIIRFSDRRVSKVERHMLIACAAFLEPWSSSALQAIFGRPDGPEVLRQLLDRSLVDESEDGTFSLHPVVQEYYATLGHRIFRRRWGTFTMPNSVYSLLRKWVPVDLEVMCLLSFFRRSIGRHLLASVPTTLEDRQRVASYLLACMDIPAIIELEKPLIQIRKNPWTVVFYSWVLALAVAVVVAILYMILHLLEPTRWPWVVWLTRQQAVLFGLVAAVIVFYWSYRQTINLRRSCVTLTQDLSLCMDNRGGEMFYSWTPFSWIAFPTGWNRIYRSSENAAEGVMPDSRSIGLFGERYGRLLLQDRVSATRGPLWLPFGIVAQPEECCRTICDALKSSQDAKEQTDGRAATASVRSNFEVRP